MSSSSSTHPNAPRAHGSGSSDSPVGVILMATLGALIITVLSAWAAGTDFWFPVRASTVAAEIDYVFNVITWICIFFFALIMILMVVFIVRYRRMGHEKATSDVTHNTPLELTWTIIPLLLVIAIFYVGMEGYMNLRRPPIGAYEVRVIAKKWSFEFQHRNGASESGILRVPVGRPVKLLMESQDVLHAMFIPGFRVKQDIVPGRVSYLWFEANQVGEFNLYCAEYCGKDHSMMRGTVIVHPVDEFEAQLTEVANYHKRLKTDEELAYYAGERIYPRCTSCHSLDGKSGTGPSWIETNSLWGKERFFTDGAKQVVDENYIRESILTPQKHIVANFSNGMPSFQGQLDDIQIRAVTLFLRHINDYVANGKLKPKADTPAAAPATPAESPPAN